MLFTNDIKILNIIKNQKPQLPNNFYDYRDIFQECKMPPEKYMISLRNLEENGAISFGNKEKTAFLLEGKGLYYREYQWHCIRKYIFDKLIDFIALIISVIALVVSLN